ncbi:MAG TPA: choice-of-anchor P family protein [Ktedonobacteraceae bacterium]|nr:choice-of-anchor P family protein [Ktedonobacteraceae bacterium]
MKTVMRFTLLLVSVFLLMLTAVTSPVLASSKVTSSSGVLPAVAHGSAYAGYLKVPKGGHIASVGPLFPVGLGCNTSSKTVSATAGSLSLSGFATSGSLVDKVTTNYSMSTVSVQASSDVQNVNVLSGLISADEVDAVAASTATSSSASSSNNSTFTNLVVLGNHINGTPAPNTKITLPGLGYVILNEQVGPVNHHTQTHISVTAIDVVVTTTNGFNLPIGTHILIAHAESGITVLSFPAIVGARAYGLLTYDKIDRNFVKSGPFANVSIGCSGGNKTNSVASVTVPVIGSTGTITDTAFGKIQPAGGNANSSSTVEQLDLLSGLISADTVMSSTKTAFSTSGSASATTSLVNAVVNGVPISANPAPNTRIDIAGLGYVIVNEQTLKVTSSRASASVNAFDVVVTANNSYGLPIGVHIIIAHADSHVNTF